MNRLSYLLFVFLFLYAPINFLVSQTAIPLTRGWRFQWADSLRFADPAYTDSHWYPIDVQRWWSDQGFPRTAGIGWYRIRVIIPTAMQKESYLQDSIVFHLGKIDDFDQVFLNGELIGENGRGIPHGCVPTDTFATRSESLWNVPRRYALAVTDPRIHWNKENVIAIRVYNWGGPGGMFGGGQSIAMADISEYLQVRWNKGVFTRTNSGWQKRLNLKNTSRKYQVFGRLQVSIRDNIRGTVMMKQERKFRLTPGASTSFLFDFPQTPGSATVRYRIQVKHSQRTRRLKEGLPYILTPPPAREPEIHPPYVYGQRPGHPFLFRIAASGERPLQFTAQNLPPGLTLEAYTGIVRGVVSKAGNYPVTITVRNKYGQDVHTIQFVIGDTLALTPPMGWNSWNVWGLAVTQDRVWAAAKALVQSRIVDFGWQFVNVDDGWEIPGKAHQPGRSPQGEILTNKKFPDMKALGDSLHALGLKFGIYSSPGPLTCGGYTGSYQHEVQDAHTFARWGVDYLKYDLCHYRDLMKDVNNPSELIPPYRKMGNALRQLSRDIVYSICEYGNGKVWEWGAKVGGNLWRTTGDIWDSWERVVEIGFQQDDAAPYAGPGHWNDPDMLVIGWVGWGEHLHYTRLTPDEQYTHVSLWCLLAAPLILGCDLEKLDDFTLNLITNPEVIAIDQDPLGKQGRMVWARNSIRAYAKKLADGSIAVGIFNLANQTQTVEFPITAAGITATARIRDVWRRKNLGRFKGTFNTILPPHGVRLIQLTMINQ